MKILEPLVRSKPRERFSMSDWVSQFQQYVFNGNAYTLPVQTTMPGEKAERIGHSFEGYVRGGLYANGVIFGLESKRIEVFSQARFQYQRLEGGRPTDLWGDSTLEVLENPWPGGTTGDLLATMLLYADFGGQAYVVRSGAELVVLRPDWCDVILGERAGRPGKVKLGLRYFEGGDRRATPIEYIASEVAHFAPKPDPLSEYLGMSWLTPVIREIQADGAMTGYKLAFTENAATPNLAVSLESITDPDQFSEFVEKMDESHRGWQNAYKTLYLGAGADVTVIGSDLSKLDFKSVQGAGETRLAQAAGVPPVVADLSEGMQGSSLNAGNYGQSRRKFTDTTCAWLWQNVAGSLQTIIRPAPGNRLWVDTRDIPFLREDEKDAADIEAVKASTIRQYVDGGFTPESAVAAVDAGDVTLLEHTGKLSVQLQEPGSQPAEAPPT